MNLDKMVAEAKERLHRSIGQRARWAKAEIVERAQAIKMIGALKRIDVSISVWGGGGGGGSGR